MKDFEEYRVKILQPTEPVSAQELSLYAQNKLTAANKRKVELAIADNEFVADALEGISLMKNPADLPQIITTIHENISHKTTKTMGSSNNKANLYWAVAAVVIIALFGTFFLFRQPTKENQLAERTSEPIEPLQETTMPQTTAEQDVTTPEVAISPTEVTPEQPSATTLIPAKENKPKKDIVEQTTSKAADIAPPATPVPVAPQVAKAPTAPEIKASAINQGVPIVANTSQIPTSSKRTVAEDVSSTPIITGKTAIAEIPIEGMIKIYTNKQYNIAADVAEMSLKQNPKQPIVNYIAGASYLILGKNTLAKNKLLLLFGQENTETFAGSELKTIIDLVRVDKFEEAKTLVLQHKWDNDRLVKVE